jgi:hypothetical protein
MKRRSKMYFRNYATVSDFTTVIIGNINYLNRKYPQIDWGGCGVFAYYLSNLLDINGIPNQINFVPEKNTPPVGAHRCDVLFHHILVRVGDLLIDKKSRTSPRYLN